MMLITLQQKLVALLPLLIIGLIVVIVMLSIACKRNHFLVAILSVLGLNITFFSLWFVSKVGVIDVTPLIHVDNYSILYTGLVLLASLATCAFAYPWLESYQHNGREEFYLLILIASLGGIVLASANHLAALFLGIELFSLPLFGLVGYCPHQKQSLEASIKYMILSASASSFLLFGIALFYAQTGNLSFLAISHDLCDHMLLHNPMLLAGLGLMITAFGFKLSLVPFHLWTPDVYQGAPVPVSNFLATASKIAIFSVLMRLCQYVLMQHSEAVHMVLSIISFTSIIFGNLMAMNQKNIKRLLGYSSVSHVGYLLVLLIALPKSKIFVESVSIYLVSYLFSNIGAFGVINLLSSSYYGSEASSLVSYRGLFWRRPILSVIMTIMMLSLAGIPMTIGFIGKFYLLSISIQAHLWWLIAAIIIGSSIGFYYYMRVVITLYLNLNASQQSNYNYNVLHNRQYSTCWIVILISALVVLILGIYPQPLITVVQHILISSIE